MFIPTAQLTDEVEFLNDIPMNVPSRVVSFTSDDHMIVVKRVKEEAGTASFDEVKDDIEQMLLSQKSASLQSQFMQELRARASVEILDEELFRMISHEEPEDVTAESEEIPPAASAPEEATVSEENEPAEAEEESSEETPKPEEISGDIE